MLGDIQIKMRLKVSGSRDEVRQDYMPLLASKIVLPLTRKDEAAVGHECLSEQCFEAHKARAGLV